MRVAVLDGLRDRFAVSHLRLAHIYFNAVGALKNVDLNVEVQLAHALDDGFARFLVGLDAE